MDILYIVVPCYNEEEVLHETSKRLEKKLNQLIGQNQISKNSKVLFVDDGSKDKTWQIITELHEQNQIFSGLKLSCNKGHQNALLAGLMTAKDLSDVTISLDADLQDDIEVIDQFIEKYKQGCDIVYGVRSARDTDTFFKKTTARGFYKLMEIMGVSIQKDHADYRLMSKRALQGLEQFDEVNLFLRGIVKLIGYKSDVVYYKRSSRFAGESKYPLKKMLNFACDGITSFSVKPIRLVTALGFIIFVVSLIMLIYFFIIKLLGRTETGWTSLVGSIWLLSGIQLLSLGIIGEYIGKIYKEVKSRPRYIIEQIIDENSDKE
ncbi:MAG: glycosyltransferase family 2 protein [Clostridiales bacterium]|nr:glycosyltransferase family 2 protein [Clostridiales bacterium]